MGDFGDLVEYSPGPLVDFGDLVPGDLEDFGALELGALDDLGSLGCDFGPLDDFGRGHKKDTAQRRRLAFTSFNEREGDIANDIAHEQVLETQVRKNLREEAPVGLLRLTYLELTATKRPRGHIALRILGQDTSIGVAKEDGGEGEKEGDGGETVHGFVVIYTGPEL